MPDATPVRTVGQLRAALEGVPDDREIAMQVVGEDGGAWYMLATFTPKVRGMETAALTLRHPTLKKLPPIPNA